jgi:hypothetical protein
MKLGNQRVVVIAASLAAFMLAGVVDRSAAQESAKSPIPSASAQQEARRTVLEIHDGEYRQAKSTAQKTDLAKKMLAEGRETKDDAAGRYMLFSIASDIAVGLADATLAVSAIDEIDRFYNADVPAMKADVFAAIAKSAVSTTQNLGLAEAALSAVEGAVAAGDFDNARRMIQTGQAAARKAKNPDLAKRLTARAKMFDEEKNEFLRISQSLEKLKSTPADPAANRIVGKHRCFRQNDWRAGLPMLVAGDDTGLKAVARAELQNPTDLTDQVALGDAWWQLSETGEPRDKAACQTRAVKWYRLALPSTTGLVQAKINKRLEGLTKSERVVRKIRFASPKVLSQFVGPEGPDMDRAVVNGRLVLSASRDARPLTTFRESFNSITSVVIRGAIVPPAKHNIRVSVGDINVFFNWEGGDENLISNAGRSASLRPSALTPGVVQSMEFKQQGSDVVILVDGKKLYEAAGRLEGTVTIYTWNSTIAIEEIVIEGVPNSTKTVEGPSHANTR